MKRYFEAGALLVLLIAPAGFAQKGPAKRTPVREPAPAVESRGSAPRPPAKAPEKINDPGASVALRLLQMTPEQRERALEKFPPQRQMEIRQRLERLDNLPPQQQQRLIRQYQMLASLSPETQRLVRQQIQAFNQLPGDRKQIVAPEMQKLRRMPEDKREARIASENFKSKFSPAEQQMLSTVSQYMPLF
jgi:Protein of unknown function (DUF3106)